MQLSEAAINIKKLTFIVLTQIWSYDSACISALY